MDAEETPGEGRVMLGPLLLIVIGILFLLNNMYPGVFRFGKMWPVILIVIGLAKVIEYIQGQSAGDKKEGE
jgi:hypothetical protein